MHNRKTIEVVITALSRTINACRIHATQNCLFLALLCVATTSCVLPIKQVRGVSGKSGAQDYSFVKAGVTTREEVIEKLGWMDSGIQENQVFWGRWSSSGKTVLIGGPEIGVADYTSYKTRNLLIEFDGRGRVTSVRLFNENEIARTLLDLCQRSGECPASQQTITHINVRWLVDENNRNRRWIDATLRAGADFIQLTEAAPRALSIFLNPSRPRSSNEIEIPRNDIEGFDIKEEKSSGYPENIFMSIVYGNVSQVNKYRGLRPVITLQISPRNLYELIKCYPRQSLWNIRY